MKNSSIIVTILLVSNIAVAQEDICSGIIGVREVSLQTKSLNEASSINSKHCENSSFNKSSSGNLSLSIPKIPLNLKLGGGSTKQKMSHFCKHYSSWKTKTEEEAKFRSSTTSQQWRALEQCHKLQGKGVLIQPELGKETILLTIRRGSENFNFLSLHYRPESAFSCTSVDLKDSKVKNISEFVNTEVNTSNEMAIVCQRNPKKESGRTYFESGDITVTTSKGSLLIPVSSDEKFGLDYASQIKVEIEKLKNKVVKLHVDKENLAAQLNEQKLRINKNSKIKLKTRYTRDRTSCKGNSTYIGPNKASAHGGFCVSLVK